MTAGRIELALAPDHPAYAGHFPGNPMAPGVVLLDLALAAIGGQAGLDLARCTLANVKFHSPARPGEPVMLRYAGQPNGTLRFELDSNGRKLASGVLRPDADGQ